jgi:hypothetical protein
MCIVDVCNVNVSMPSCSCGFSEVNYAGHEISHLGLIPKAAKRIQMSQYYSTMDPNVSQSKCINSTNARYVWWQRPKNTIGVEATTWATQRNKTERLQTKSRLLSSTCDVPAHCNTLSTHRRNHFGNRFSRQKWSKTNLRQNITQGLKRPAHSPKAHASCCHLLSERNPIKAAIITLHRNCMVKGNPHEWKRYTSGRSRSALKNPAVGMAPVHTMPHGRLCRLPETAILTLHHFAVELSRESCLSRPRGPDITRGIKSGQMCGVRIRLWCLLHAS